MLDTATTYWVAEFLLRQRNISDTITKSIHLALPILPTISPPPSLRRLVLLRQLSSCQSITPKTLESIHLLNCLNPNPLASTCYLKVAAHLAVTSSDFPNTVDTLFKQRMRDIVESMSPLAAGLVSERMKEMAEEMERAVINSELREKLIERKRMDATEAIKAFVDKEWEEILNKPSFIEIVAAAALGEPGAEKAWETGEKGPLGGPATNASVIDKGKNVISTRSSLMDRKPTACTYQWDDSISEESDSGNCSGESKKVRMPSATKKDAICPLKSREYQRVVRRRRVKKWSILEEDTLRKGVKMHGRGNWKEILNCYPNIFEERTEVDLKDKWRNMTRS